MKLNVKHILMKTIVWLLAIILCYIPVGVQASGVSEGLSALTLSSGSLSPAFSPDITSYTAVVGGGLSSILVIPTAQDTSSTITVNGSAAKSGVPFEIPLSGPTCNISIEVISAGNIPTCYTVTVTIQSGAAAGLLALSLSSGALSPMFYTNTFSYSANVGGNTVNTYITATPADPSQTITINGAAASNGSPFPVALMSGDNNVVIYVTAKNGTNATYSVDIKRASGGTFVGLSNLGISPGTFSGNFSPTAYSYTASVNASDVYLTPTAADPSQTVTISGTAVQSGSQYHLSLTAVTTTVTINVYSAGGGNAVYTVLITRISSGASPGLSSLLISPGTLSPSFSTGTLSYSANVNASGINITPIVVDPSQTININGTIAQNGVSFYLSLNPGTNAIAVVVTSAGGASKTYNINLTCLTSSSLNLSALSLSHGLLSPSFDPDIVSYTAEVDSDVNEITVATTVADASSKAKVNGATTTTVALNPGYNTIVVTVTAADTSTKTYTVNVKREFVTQVSVTTPDVNGSYSAAVPDYVSQLDSTDTFTFTLGDDILEISAPSLNAFYSAGGLTVSQSQSSQSTFSKVYAAAPAGCTALSATDINLTGGSTTANCSINALVTFNLSSDMKSQLKSGVPMLYYYDNSTNSFEDTGAVFDLSAGTAVFKAQDCGTYVLAVSLAGNISYSVDADTSYKVSGDEKSFNVSVTRADNSPCLSGGQIMVVTTLADGSQTFSFTQITGDSSVVPVYVDGQAKQSAVYIIAGNFNGTNIPKTYALTKFVD